MDPAADPPATAQEPEPPAVVAGVPADVDDLDADPLEVALKQATAPRPSKSRKSRVISIVLAVATIAVTFLFVLPRFADYSSVWDVLTGITWPYAVALLVVSVANFATYAPPWMAALPGLSYGAGSTVAFTSAAISSVMPAGGAIGMATQYNMLRGWAFERRAVALALVLTGVFNQAVSLLVPVLAVTLLGLTGGRSGSLELAAIVGVAVLVVAAVAFVAILRSESGARQVGNGVDAALTKLRRLFRKGPARGAGDTLVRFRRESIDLLKRRWWVLLGTQLLGTLTVFLVLLACLRAVGISSDEVTWIEAMAAWSLVRLLTSIPLAPAGFGIMEVGLTTSLVGFGGDQAEVVAAVLLYRFLTWAPTVLLGLVTGLTWRRHAHAVPAD